MILQWYLTMRRKRLAPKTRDKLPLSWTDLAAKRHRSFCRLFKLFFISIYWLGYSEYFLGVAVWTWIFLQIHLHIRTNFLFINKYSFNSKLFWLVKQRYWWIRNVLLMNVQQCAFRIQQCINFFFFFYHLIAVIVLLFKKCQQ